MPALARVGIGDWFSKNAPKIMYKSIAQWPAEIKLGTAKNESTDSHQSREAAEAVCRRLQRDGFGGEGKIFPLTTRVEGPADESPKKPARRFQSIADYL